MASDLARPMEAVVTSNTLEWSIVSLVLGVKRGNWSAGHCLAFRVTKQGSLAPFPCFHSLRCSKSEINNYTLVIMGKNNYREPHRIMSAIFKSTTLKCRVIASILITPLITLLMTPRKFSILGMTAPGPDGGCILIMMRWIKM